MNERIQELSYQCWYNDPDTGKEEFNRTKFAQLIVKECIRLCDQVDLVGADECIDNIKEHFEVEE